MIPNYYQTLGLEPTASKEDIKKRYQKLALIYHPDKNKSPDSHEKFISINEAYLILYDYEAREEYDKEYHFYYSKKEQQTTKSPRSGYNQYNDNQNKEQFDNEDLNQWAKNAREQAEEFAKMAFKDFSKLLLSMVKEAGFQLGNALIGMIGASFFVSGIFSIFSGNIIFSIIFIPLGILLLIYVHKNYDQHDV